MKKLFTVLVSALLLIPISLCTAQTVGYADTDETCIEKYENSFINECLSSNPYNITTYSSLYVQTPNGTNVSVSVRKDEDLSWVESTNNEGDALVPSATRVGDASPKYNCHSYAWYMQSTENPYWMNDPSAYYIDGSYMEVSEPSVGDRICYFKSNGKNDHSGIVISISDNEIRIRSKWGSYGLYEHSIYDCIYTSSYGGSADIVKFYHRHEYNYISVNTTTHTRTCACGINTTEKHTYTYKSAGSSKHTATCVCGYSKSEIHTWTSYSFTLESCSVLDFYEDILENVDDFLADPQVGGYEYVQCVYCGYIKKLGSGDIVPVG